MGARVCATGGVWSLAWAVAPTSAHAASAASMGTTNRLSLRTTMASGGRADALSGLDEPASGQLMTFAAASTSTISPTVIRYAAKIPIEWCTR